MNWMRSFEAMCYGIVLLMLVDLIRRRDFDNLFAFGSAALVGFVMELAAVAATDVYCYNPGFLLNLGFEPEQFPVFGGFMWGGLTVYGIKLAQKLKWDRVRTALAAGMFIVTMDLLLDAAAIRLDGGFWVWVGREIGMDIDRHAFMGVIWVNFLGYMIETPTVVWLTLRKRERVDARDWKKQTKWMLLIALAAIGVTAAGSLIALGLNAVTDDWFACIAFVLIWCVLAAMMTGRCLRLGMRRKPGAGQEWPMLIFWAAMYGYCLIALCRLRFLREAPWFMAAGVLFAAATVYLSAAEAAGGMMHEIMAAMALGGVYAAKSFVQPKSSKEVRRLKEWAGGFCKGVCHPADDRMDDLREANIEWVRFDVGERPLDGEGNRTREHIAFRERAKRYHDAGYRVMAVTPFPEQYSKTPFSPTDPVFKEQIVSDIRYLAKDLQDIVSAFQVSNEMQVEIFRFPLTEEQGIDYLGIQLEALNEVKGKIRVGFNLQGAVMVDYLRKMRRYIRYCDYIGLDLYIGCFEPFVKELSFYDFVIRFIWGYARKPVMVNEFGYIGTGRAKGEEEKKEILGAYGFESEEEARQDIFGLVGRLPERFGYYLTEVAEYKTPDELAAKLFDQELRHHLYRELSGNVRLKKYDHTPEGQAQFMTDAIARLRSIPFVCGAFVYCYRDNEKCFICGQEDCPVETGWGLADRNGVRKPAWYAVREAFK